MPGYDRDTSYIRGTNHFDTDVHTVTLALAHDLGGGWTLSDDRRVTRQRRDFSAINPGGCDADCLAGLLAGIDQPLS